MDVGRHPQPESAATGRGWASGGGVRGVQRQGHETAAPARGIVAEWPAWPESGARVQRPRRSERVHGPGLQAHTAATALARDADEVGEHRPADSQTPRCLGGVHGLQLRVVPVKLPQRADAEQFAVPAEAEECDGRIKEAVKVQRVHVLRRGVRVRERQVTLQQLANVVGSRVVAGDLAHKPSSGLRVRAGTARSRCTFLF